MGIARKKSTRSAGAKDSPRKRAPANSQSQPSLSDVLDAAEQLDPECQTELIAIPKRRIAERGKNRVIADVKRARREFADGRHEPMTAAEIVREALS